MWIILNTDQNLCKKIWEEGMEELKVWVFWKNASFREFTHCRVITVVYDLKASSAFRLVIWIGDFNQVQPNDLNIILSTIINEWFARMLLGNGNDLIWIFSPCVSRATCVQLFNNQSYSEVESYFPWCYQTLGHGK